MRALRLAFTALAAAPLLAGPPFKTDDPQPVDLGHLEVYAFAMGQRVPGESSGIGPAMEFNYGAFPDTQLHIAFAVAYDRPQGVAPRSGLGDTELGVKYRFVHESEFLPQVSIFPMVELPTGDEARGLGAGHAQVYLPVWIQKSWGPWTTYGGAGWWRNPGEGNRNWSFAGWLLQRDFGEHATFGAEAFRSTANQIGGEASTGFNVGGQVNLSEKHHILFSLGRNVHGDTQTFFYVGYQFTTGTFGTLADWFRSGRTARTS